MNVAELARRLRISPQELKEKLPELGFDIGMRAIKVDDRTAWRIIENWSQLMREWQKKHAVAEVAEVAKAAEVKREVILPPVLTVREFAARLGLPITRVISELMKNGILAAMNERIDFTTASIIAQDLGFAVKEPEAPDVAGATEVKDVIRERIAKEDMAALQPRPPVVVVMGHVDHGKTKLLDAIRRTNVMAGEAGGITQHIGAYQAIRHNRNITFIDTPGHEAFTTMRSRGARIADVAILVVAADDGVQPQTLEALKIIKAAKVPYVVAINKMDKPEADADRVKRELSDKGVMSEEWGGKIPFVPISAKQGSGIDALLDVILLVADLDKDKIVANPEALALGTVIEAHIDPGEGTVATVLVQNGSLQKNDYLAIGRALYGRVRAMKDWAGKVVAVAPPGMPVKILGLRVAPEVGDIIEVPREVKGLETKKVRPAYKEVVKLVLTAPVQADVAEKAMLNVIVKADVLGSLEAILASLEKIQHSEVGIKVIGQGLGNITEAEVLQAASAGAVVYGFNVAALPQVSDLAREKGVETRTYKIIYELLSNVKARLEALLKPEIIRETLGRLKVLAIFRTEKNYVIMGGRVEDGKVLMGGKVDIYRAQEMQGSGEIVEVQSAKQKVNEARGGSECGMKIITRAVIEVGDVLEVYREEKKERKL
ncbi:MAG: Translation initiation factor IF-2 [Parcubacteria group bacterium GW2011_GWA2_47_26]|nr:MAG: Translation initiation factor IF-2 [Parcubacteria group bacterium GW2011_GWA2_47_26]